MHPDRLLWKIVGCAFNFVISSIFTASDPGVLAGQGASSHPTQEARLFRPRRPSIRQFRSNTAEIRTHMKGKVVLDNDGLSSGNFGQINNKDGQPGKSGAGEKILSRKWNVRPKSLGCVSEAWVCCVLRSGRTSITQQIIFIYTFSLGLSKDKFTYLSLFLLKSY